MCMCVARARGGDGGEGVGVGVTGMLVLVNTEWVGGMQNLDVVCNTSRSETCGTLVDGCVRLSWPYRRQTWHIQKI